MTSTCSIVLRYIFSRVPEGNAQVVHFEINVHAYNKAYYLGDSIYPDWSTHVKTICGPKEEKKKRLGE
jgi:hypothetical protein